MTHDSNGVPLDVVIRQRLIPQPDSDDIAFGLQHSEYVSHNEDMIERAPILDRNTYDRTATDKVLEMTGPFDPRYWMLTVLSGPSSRNALGPITNSISS